MIHARLRGSGCRLLVDPRGPASTHAQIRRAGIRVDQTKAVTAAHVLQCEYHHDQSHGVPTPAQIFRRLGLKNAALLT